MRIAHLGSKGMDGTGGTERVVSAIAQRHSISEDVTVYGRGRHTGHVISRGGVRSIHFRTPSGKYLAPLSLMVWSALHAVIVGRYDIVHLHGMENAFVLPLIRLRYPVVTTFHGATYRVEKWGVVVRRLMRLLEKPFVTLSSAPTSVSGPAAERLSRTYNRKVVYIPNGAEELRPDVHAAERILTKRNLAAKRYVLFAAGRIDPVKGCHTLLQAYRSSGLDAPLLIVGEPGHLPSYDVELLGLAAGLDVQFEAGLPQPVLDGVVRRARLVVFPSTVEGMSMLLLSIIRAGAPCLTSDIPENREILPPGSPTFVAADPADLARQLLRLWRLDDDRLSALGERGREWVEQRFRWDDIARQYLQVYRDVWDQRRC